MILYAGNDYSRSPGRVVEADEATCLHYNPGTQELTLNESASCD